MAGKHNLKGAGAPALWSATPDSYLAGMAAIDGADHAAVEAERKWGVGRLRLLVDAATREKYDKARMRYGEAMRSGTLDEVQREAGNMLKATQALDRLAEAAGAIPLDPVGAWEVGLKDGTVAVLCRSTEEAHRLVSDGRKGVIYTLDEIGRLIDHYREVVAAKIVWPGATVTAVRRPVDPLPAITQHDDAIEDLFA
jgi:hypothetical protein